MLRRLRHDTSSLKSMLMQCAWTATRNKTTISMLGSSGCAHGLLYKGYDRGSRFDPYHDFIICSGIRFPIAIAARSTSPVSIRSELRSVSRAASRNLG
jgi:hypothetical protein